MCKIYESIKEILSSRRIVPDIYIEKYQLFQS